MDHRIQSVDAPQDQTSNNEYRKNVSFSKHVRLYVYVLPDTHLAIIVEPHIIHITFVGLSKNLQDIFFI